MISPKNASCSLPPLSQSLYGLPLTTRSQTGWPGSLQGPCSGQLPHSTHQTGLQLRLRGGPGTLSLIGKWTEEVLGLRGAHSRVIDLSPTSHSPWRSGHHQALPHSHPEHPEAPCALEEAFWPLHYALPTFWKCHCLHVGRELLIMTLNSALHPIQTWLGGSLSRYQVERD